MSRPSDPRFDPSRRTLLGALGMAPFALAWTRASAGLRWLPGGDDRVLCVLELTGGNDGLNTLIPIDDDRLAGARPTLRQAARGAHRIADGFALHPSLGALARAFERGVTCVVHGVGYEPPDRSHFRSRDVWQTADPNLGRAGANTTGWLGRAADLLADRGAAVPAMSVGSLGVPLALSGRRAVVPAVRSLDDYELLVDAPAPSATETRDELAELVRAGSSSAHAGLRGAIATASESALAGVERLRTALDRYRPSAEYPDSALGRELQLLARIVVSGFGTRLFHLRFGGFDTHAGQAPVHAGLLAQLDLGLGALLQDLEAHRASDRFTMLVHSEFGRRVAENRSQGTDHGTAAPVFVLGGGLGAGRKLHGAAPDLGALEDGDVAMGCDFRRVYAELLGWLGVDATEVLGGAFEAVGLRG